MGPRKSSRFSDFVSLVFVPFRSNLRDLVSLVPVPLVLGLVRFIEIAIGAARPLRILLGVVTAPACTLCITLILIQLRVRHVATSVARKAIEGTGCKTCSLWDLCPR